MLRGLVIKGDGIGRHLGYRTANLDVPIKKAHLKDGVYAAWATLGDKKYSAALVVMSLKKKIEVHLLDYAGDSIYGQYLKVDPVQKVSEIENLSEDSMIKKITNDITVIRHILL